MKITEGEFLFAIEACDRRENRILSRVLLQTSEEYFEENILLLSLVQWHEMLQGFQAITLGKEQSYSSTFEESRLAVLCELEDGEWVVTFMIAPSEILTNPSKAIGIDISRLEETTESAITSRKGKTIEVELVVSMEELEEIVLQLEEDYAIMEQMVTGGIHK